MIMITEKQAFNDVEEHGAYSSRRDYLPPLSLWMAGKDCRNEPQSIWMLTTIVKCFDGSWHAIRAEDPLRDRGSGGGGGIVAQVSE